MKYDIYFHNDFDGRASAAVLLVFFEERGDTIENYVPVDHGIEIKKKWPKLKFKNPAIIVDFYYHPKAVFWFDHHETTFIKPEWRKKYRQDKSHCLDPRYPSCCHLVLNCLTRQFNFKPPAHLKELAKWLDIIDAAKYASAAQTIAIQEPALQIDAFIDWQRGGKSLSWLIRLLAEKPLATVAADPWIKNTVSIIKNRREGLLKAYRKSTHVRGTVAFTDTSKIRGEFLRFVPYYLYPRAHYGLTFKKTGNIFGISLSRNPWMRFKSIHLGEFLQKRYGGGGHPSAAGARFATRRKAEKAVREIIAYLK